MGENISTLTEKVNINVDWLYSDNPTEQIISLKTIRSSLSIKDPDIEGIVKLNIIPRVLELMLSRDDTESQMECSWIITNLASGYKHGTEEIMKYKGTHCIKELLEKTDDINVKNQCYWALSNVACDNAECRDHVLSLGIFDDLIDFIDHADRLNNENVLKISVWALANFFLTKFPPLDDYFCSKALNIFIKFFRHPHKIVRKESVYGINHIMEKRKYIDVLINSGILKDISKELQEERDSKITSNLVQIVGNIAFGNDLQTQHLIDSGFIPIFRKFLDAENKNLIKEVVWILSNIAAGNPTQVEALKNGDIFPKVVLLLNDANFKVRREAVWTITNSTQNGNYDIIVYLVKLEVLKYLTILLDDENCEIVKSCCDSIYNILLIGEVFFKNINLFAILVDKYGALRKIEHLQFHPSDDVVDKVITILETFYRRDVKEVPKI